MRKYRCKGVTTVDIVKRQPTRVPIAKAEDVEYARLWADSDDREAAKRATEADTRQEGVTLFGPSQQ